MFRKEIKFPKKQSRKRSSISHDTAKSICGIIFFSFSESLMNENLYTHRKTPLLISMDQITTWWIIKFSAEWSIIRSWKRFDIFQRYGILHIATSNLSIVTSKKKKRSIKSSIHGCVCDSLWSMEMHLKTVL